MGSPDPGCTVPWITNFSIWFGFHLKDLDLHAHDGISFPTVGCEDIEIPGIEYAPNLT